jgi:uncharacterized membrane protein YfcA
VPALTFCLDMNHYQALGTSLAAMVPTAASGAYIHARMGERPLSTDVISLASAHGIHHHTYIFP